MTIKLGNMTPDPELQRLLDKAKAMPPMTAAELREQRISFAYGNVSIHNPSITRADVEREPDKLYGTDGKLKRFHTDHLPEGSH